MHEEWWDLKEVDGCLMQFSPSRMEDSKKMWESFQHLLFECRNDLNHLVFGTLSIESNWVSYSFLNAKRAPYFFVNGPITYSLYFHMFPLS